ncbi:DNA repair exonuclease SbcCD nuclease subunit [Fervidobacterium changbaicum]|uniref:Metallophosphoesterase n=1 Tax=Fervidobacterium islandicum TaxID=2423 RepID=A0AAI8GDK1_FERIS|nr:MULTISPECIES: metallophosphoesterase [Fervidobacterium]AMW33098.1 metallophosphoesterase [Fervidobacterium islandicum]SDH11379.1 DNA repair exonuclease SbcCD nuclease subunit [Fervidobacterium changbaicum]
MKILHTSDLHLRTDSPERWQALQLIVDKAKQNSVDLLVISGDLFDSREDAVRSYERLRAIFSGSSFQTFILPGNHDETFYEDGLHFGDNVVVLSKEKSIYDFEDARIIAVPFKKEYSSAKETFAVLRQSNELTTSNKSNVLLFHGELLSPYYEPDDFGEKGRYMPVDLNLLRSLNFQYILAGHFHTKFNILRISNNYFIYPGSPVSVTKKERGKRKVNLLEIGKQPQELELGSFYYEEIEINLSIFDDEHPFDKFSNVLNSLKLPQNCSPIFKITGHFDGARFSISESELKAKIQSLADTLGTKPEVEFLAKDLGKISNDMLFKKIVDRINQQELDEESKKQLIELFVNAMM